jgi:hypothetical protein
VNPDVVAGVSDDANVALGHHSGGHAVQQAAEETGAADATCKCRDSHGGILPLLGS